MPKPLAEWTEDDVLSLPYGENDTFERKGRRKLDLTIPQVDENDVRDELAKQLSAFANTGGGRIIYGVTDAGTVDNGGIARLIRGTQSTKEWLEDVIPNLTDLEIIGFNVYEIRPKETGSLLLPDKSLYIVDVPDSERAPHQSRCDFKYYVRLGGKSRPAPHRLVEDIRNRARHPKLEIYDLRIQNAVADQPRKISGLKSGLVLRTLLSFNVRNVGRVRASTSCLQIHANIPLSMTFMNDHEYFTRSANQGAVLIELKNASYPEMSFPLAVPINISAEVEVLQQGESLTLAGANLDDVRLFITTFADSAPAQQQEFKLSEIDPEGWFAKVTEQEVERIRDSER